MAAKAGLPSSSNKSKIVWFWQQNSSLSDGRESNEWECFSDFQSEFLEEAYQRNDVEVQLDDYIVDFKRSVQFKKSDPNKESIVKREEAISNNYLRKERFSHPENISKPFIINDRSCSEFITEWHRKNPRLKCWMFHPEEYAYIASEAADGILKEGRLLHKEFDAQRMAGILRTCIGQADSLKCAARLYSLETFLYKLVNSTLRNNDRSKANTLGPFCYLLQLYSQSTEHLFDMILYRGMSLTDEMIEDYKKAVGTKIQWLAFTSTSKVRAVAELYGNTLFIIRLVPIVPIGANLSSVSYFPAELEVLLPAGQVFLVEKMNVDPNNGKYCIYMRNC